MPCSAFKSSGVPKVITCARKCTGSASSSSGVLNHTTRRATFKISGVMGKGFMMLVRFHPSAWHKALIWEERLDRQMQLQYSTACAHLRANDYNLAITLCNAQCLYFCLINNRCGNVRFCDSIHELQELRIMRVVLPLREIRRLNESKAKRQFNGIKAKRNQKPFRFIMV